MPATNPTPRSPSYKGGTAGTLSNGVNRSVPVVSPSSQKGIPHTCGVCVQQVETYELLRVMGPADPCGLRRRRRAGGRFPCDS